MKYLPRKYRESQTDWFGKRGIPWHIKAWGSERLAIEFKCLPLPISSGRAVGTAVRTSQ